MTRSTFSTLVELTHTQMLPSQSNTGKRKPEDLNPLLNAAAAKRAKKEAKLGTSNKRKANNDDTAGGLVIVRAPESGPSHSQPTLSNDIGHVPPRFPSQPVHSNMAGPSHHPNKKFRAESEVPARSNGHAKASKSEGRDRVAHQPGYDDAEVEKDVRAMEDEADRLRRQSRAHTTIDVSLLASESLNIPPRSEPRSNPNRTKGKAKVVDSLEPLPERDTPQMDRNKALRQGAMDAIINDRSRSPARNGKPTGHRRKSSVGGRGKRISSSFETMGIITQPHNSVSETSFYKHLDADLPEPERVRQLLIWCTLRAGSTSSSSKPPSSSSSSQPAPPSLPPLSAEGVKLVKAVQDDLVRMLAEKRINLSLYEPEAGRSKHPPEELRENAQNVRNRQLEVTYTQHIQQAQAEEEAWKKVSYEYDAYGKKLQSSLEKRSAAVQLDPGAMSAKAKGKRRATGEIGDVESHLIPQEHALAPEFHPALALARSVLGLDTSGADDRPIGGGGRRGGGLSATGNRATTNRKEIEAELKRRLPELEYKVDQVFSYVSAARTTTNIAEKMLNERFDVLSANLTARMNPARLPEGAGGGGAVPESATALLSTYVTPQSDMDGTSPAEGGGRNKAGGDALDLMRALSRVDTARPPAMVGDAARRAAREVQRAEETGAVAVGDRRLTGLPATPRKAPGTPRRGNTPLRDR